VRSAERDYGAKAATYGDTFMNDIRWSNINKPVCALRQFRVNARTAKERGR